MTRHYRYSTATPPSPPYSEWDLTAWANGGQSPDHVPDLNAAYVREPFLRWIAEPRLDPRGGRTFSGLILAVLSAAFGVAFLVAGVALWPLAGSGALAISVLGAFLLGIVFLEKALIGRSSKGELPARGESWMSIGPPTEIRTVEECLRAAVAAVGERVTEDHRRGWRGRGFEWRLAAPIVIAYRRQTAEDTATITVTSRGAENVRLHQRLKGEIVVALRGRRPVEPVGPLSTAEARLADPPQERLT
jgi:hypothetical protein